METESQKVVRMCRNALVADADGELEPYSGAGSRKSEQNLSRTRASRVWKRTGFAAD